MDKFTRGIATGQREAPVAHHRHLGRRHGGGLLPRRRGRRHVQRRLRRHPAARAPAPASCSTRASPRRPRARPWSSWRPRTARRSPGATSRRSRPSWPRSPASTTSRRSPTRSPPAPSREDGRIGYAVLTLDAPQRELGKPAFTVLSDAVSGDRRSGRAGRARRRRRLPQRRGGVRRPHRHRAAGRAAGAVGGLRDARRRRSCRSASPWSPSAPASAASCCWPARWTCRSRPSRSPGWSGWEWASTTRCSSSPATGRTGSRGRTTRSPSPTRWARPARPSSSPVAPSSSPRPRWRITGLGVLTSIGPGHRAHGAHRRRRCRHPAPAAAEPARRPDRHRPAGASTPPCTAHRGQRLVALRPPGVGPPLALPARRRRHDGGRRTSPPSGCRRPSRQPATPLPTRPTARPTTCWTRASVPASTRRCSSWSTWTHPGSTPPGWPPCPTRSPRPPHIASVGEPADLRRRQHRGVHCPADRRPGRPRDVGRHRRGPCADPRQRLRLGDHRDHGRRQRPAHGDPAALHRHRASRSRSCC